MDVFSLVPKDKFDCSGIETLKSIDIKDAEPILYDLMVWMQDLNWPVAKELKKVLPRFHENLVPHTMAIFNSDDDIWKSWTLLLLKDFPSDTVRLLANDIKRIAENPTKGELMEEANEYASELIQQFNLNIY
jgi:hypothetical protein